MLLTRSGVEQSRANPAVGFPEMGRSGLGERVDRQARLQVEARAAGKWQEYHERGARAVALRGILRRGWRMLNRLKAPILFPWSPSRRGVGIEHELHRIAAALAKRAHGGWVSRLGAGVQAAAWLPTATLASVWVLGRNGPWVRERYGMQLWDQWIDLLDAAWRYGIFPSAYYHHRVFLVGPSGDKARHLSERELGILLAACECGGKGRPVENVFRFLSECRAQGLPTPRTFAAFAGGAAELFAGADGVELPRKDLYFRPERWEEGGGRIWRWNGQSGRWQHRAESLEAAALFERCRVLAAGRPFLLQECLRNHPDVERFSAGGLCSVRVATGLNEAGEPVALLASLRLQACDADGLPTAAGELEAGIDIASGTLQPACGEFVSDGEFDSHPGTGAVMAGVVLPLWRHALELALRAHREFRERSFLGWEIGLTPAGPVLLEASGRWAAFHHAQVMDSPFPQLCVSRLASVEARRSEFGAGVGG